MDYNPLDSKKDVAVRVDPITMEIIRCALKAAANEMSVVLKRTAYNMKQANTVRARGMQDCSSAASFTTRKIPRSAARNDNKLIGFSSRTK